MGGEREVGGRGREINWLHLERVYTIWVLKVIPQKSLQYITASSNPVFFLFCVCLGERERERQRERERGGVGSLQSW